VQDEIRIETARLIIRTVTTADVDDVARSGKLDEGPIPRAEAEQQVQWMLTTQTLVVS